MRILVTGGNGFIGSALCNHLVKNPDYEVTNVDSCIFNNHTTLNLFNQPNYKFIKQDVRSLSRDFLKGFDTICLCAALVGAPFCDTQPQNTREVNYESVKRIADKSRAKLVYLNTNSSYGTCPDVCTEFTPMNPLSLYAETKCKAEEYIQQGKNVSLRLATVCGVSARPRMDLMVNNFVAQLYFNNQIVLFEPHFRRNFVGIRDVVRAMVWSFGLEGVYNVGLDRANCTKLELAEKVKSLVAPTATIHIGNGKDPDQRDYNVSSAKLENTSFRFKSSLEENILSVRDLCRAIGPTCLEYKNY